MNFKTPLSGNTLLGRMLATSSREGQYKIIELIDWTAPDTGVLPAPLHYGKWGVEIICNHPLSTIAAVCPEEVFISAVEIAHTKQQDQLRLKVNGDVGYISISDWVATGVVSTVLEYGTPNSLKVLLDKLPQRSSLTTSLVFFDENRDRPSPFMGLARSQDSEAVLREKLRLLYDHVATEGSKQYISNSPRQFKNMQKRCMEHAANMILTNALHKGNTKLVDALSGVGEGPLGFAQLTPNAIDAAMRSYHLSALVHTLNKHPCPAQALNTALSEQNSRPGGSKLIEIVPDLYHSAFRLLFRIHPEIFTGVEAPSTWGVDKIKDPQQEMAAHREVAKLALQAMLISPPNVPTKTKYGSNVSLCPLFLTAPATQVDEVYDLVEKLTDRCGSFFMPSFKSWLLIGQAGPSPWLDRLTRHLAKATPRFALDMLYKFEEGFRPYFKDAFSYEEEQTDLYINATIKAAQCFWETMAAAGKDHCLPFPTAGEWIDDQAASFKEEEKSRIRKLLLSAVVQPAARSAPPSMKM